MDESKIFVPKTEKKEKPFEELTPKELEQIVIDVDMENMKPLPEDIKKKVAALRKKWEEEHKEG